MDHETGRIDGCKDCLTIDKDLDGRFFGAEEAKSDLVETRGDGQDHALVLVPQEVLGACVDALQLPRHGIPIGTQLA